jgi:hypothetical protein
MLGEGLIDFPFLGKQFCRSPVAVHFSGGSSLLLNG